MRPLRLVLAAAAVAGVVVPLAAHAAPPQPPYSCTLRREAIAQWTDDVPVVGGSYVYTYRLECYG